MNGHGNGHRVASDASSIRLSHKSSVGDFVPDVKPTYQAGHIETLTPDQEYVLKEAWCFLLKQMGYQLELPSKLKSADSGVILRRTTTTSSSHTTKSSSGKSGKKKFLGRLGKKKSGSNSSSHQSSNSAQAHNQHHYHHAGSGSTGQEHNVEAITAKISKLSTDPGISLEDEREILSNLKDFKPADVKKHFFNFLRHDTPDNLILRFVRARKFHAGNSLKMLSATLKWRVIESKVDDVLAENELGNVGLKGLMNAFEKGKAYFRGYDKNGRPLVIVRPRLHHSSAQTEEETQIFILLVIEYARLILTEPVDSATILFDLTGFSLSNMDYPPVKFMISMFEAHYPESLGVLLIHKAPWIFGGIWSVIKNWLDPVVASKINFTRSTKDLLKFIPQEQLSKEHGGSDPYEYHYVRPTQADHRKRKDELYEELVAERDELITNFIEATVLWIESTNVAENDNYRAEKILLGRELANNYIKLQPYLINRTYYHKNGLMDLQPFDVFYDTEN